MATILCPYDFSESSDAALDLAVSVAQERGSRLLLFHVDPPATISERFLAHEKHLALLREHNSWLESRLAAARLRLHGENEVEVISRITRGDPGDEITRAADELDVELIVMSTHSSALRRTLLGSVAESVARHAPCPVLLVRDHNYATFPFNRALVCIDFSSASDSVEEAARGLCGENAERELIHVVDEPGVAALQVSLGHREEVLSLLDTLHKDARLRLEEFAATLPLVEKPPSQTVIGGPIAGTILSHASDVGSPLIVIGSHEPANVRERILGTVADRVLHRAEVPVLLVPAGARSIS